MMGSVMSHEVCPECKFAGCMTDYYYRTDELYVNCPRCGYNYMRTLDKNTGEWTVKESKPKGAFRYRIKGAVATSCGFYKSETGLLKDFVEALDKLDEMKYTKLVRGKWVQVDMLTKKVVPFKEYSEEEDG